MSNPSISLDDVRYFTETSHVQHFTESSDVHELSIKIQLKEWTTALLLKHLLVSWDWWTYCIGFKLVGINIIIIIIIIKSPHCVSRECWAHSVVRCKEIRRCDAGIDVAVMYVSKAATTTTKQIISNS